jgi:hypothetical protein
MSDPLGYIKDFFAKVDAFTSNFKTSCVCIGCVLPMDKIVGDAGDYSLCSRCWKSVTSKTGVQVKGM